VFSVKQAFVETLRAEQELFAGRKRSTIERVFRIVRRLSKVGSAAYTDVLKQNFRFRMRSLRIRKRLKNLRSQSIP